MKILVYGAGVLGSYLAHGLHRGGHAVTLLARGKRLHELTGKGLVIRHYVQCRTTRDQISLTSSLEKDDAYDMVFAVMRRNQLDGILPLLCENEGSSLYVLVGNNPTARDTQRFIEEHSRTRKRVVFAFQSTGGRREKGRVVSVHTGLSTSGGHMAVGSLTGDDSWKPLFAEAFQKTHYKISYSDDMDA